MVNDSHDKHYELKREKASEVVVFLSCDLDRKWEESKIRCAPICWFTKGYSLDTETMRQILEGVLDACFKERMHVPAISFDGQWHNIAVRDSTGVPLTLLQLKKDVWKSTESMSKASIFKEIKSLNCTRTWYFEAQPGTNRIIICTNNGERLPRISPRLKNIKINEAGSKSVDDVKVPSSQEEAYHESHKNRSDPIAEA